MLRPHATNTMILVLDYIALTGGGNQGSVKPYLLPAQAR